MDLPQKHQLDRAQVYFIYYKIHQHGVFGIPFIRCNKSEVPARKGTGKDEKNIVLFDPLFVNI